jgi:hypothetical protein
MTHPLLAHRTCRLLQLVSHAHGIGLNTRWNKAQRYQHVRRALLDTGGLARAFRRLSADEREPLIALQVAGGTLRLDEFTRRFGQIRRYRPWRVDAPPHPWRRPVSCAEKLWHLALIEISPRAQVLLPDEVRALLPPIPRPAPVTSRMAAPRHPRATCLRQLAGLLSLLLSGRARWVHGRWLSPKSVAAVQARSFTAITPDQVRFLHYLADVSGLIAQRELTPAAWIWLTAPDAWSQLLTAVRADLHSRHPRWEQFRLPAITTPAWDALLRQIASLTPGQTYSLTSVCTALRFDLAPILTEQLLHTVLTWVGLVVTEGDQIMVPTPYSAPPQPAYLRSSPAALDLDLPLFPPLRSLVEIGAWAEFVGSQRLHVDQDAVRRAVQQGYDHTQIIALLADITGAPLPPSVVNQIRTWVKQADQITLRPLLILTAQNSEHLRRLRADWRLRPLFGELLSPHHVVVPAARAPELCRRLQRRGFPVTVPHSAPPPSEPTHPEYAYLAARIVQLLGSITPPDIRLPGAVTSALRQSIDPAQAEALDQAAAAYVERLRHALTGTLVAQGGVAQADPDAIRQQVAAAHAQSRPLHIVYYSPARGEETSRTIEPILLYERNGAAYVEAWCQLDQAARTFRLDRIVRVCANELNLERSRG